VRHTVETADEHDGCCFMCTCGEEFNGQSWEDLGKKFDEHVYEACEDDE
jgi:hypothetical protein